MIFENIKINVKTLNGDRKLYSYQVNIKDKISVIIQNLVRDEKNISQNTQYRIISTNGFIKELDPNKRIYEENIKENQTLILTDQINLVFSDAMHGPGIIVNCLI